MHYFNLLNIISQFVHKLIFSVNNGSASYYFICRDKSGVGHGVTWRYALSAKRVEIEGATAFAVSGSSCSV